ncbi:MAG TPA: mandelate racemase/muconate lactonizing enzyme family protein [Coxiellaceae bacterium]|nr:MAG: hypothetical protein A3E81_01150 [Gammaproteobacteria bacterium RIFCSPHIGHO2_12_FULL_36_30]HLB56767.1 mandelate racemase/muconate lactonizing enzyme family protein [Coxiellaceae bacterium]
MKTKTLEIKQLNFPLKKSITTNVCTIHSIDAIALFLDEQQGIVGKSFIHVLGEMPCDAITAHIKKIYAFAKAHGAYDHLATWKQFWFDYQFENKNKAEIYALAALDIAAWDLFAKIEKKPLHQLISNQSVNSVRVYGTTGWLSLSEKELITECEKYAMLGINGFKIRLGHQNDFERVKAVRRAMGDDYVLMLDATQQFSVKDAIEISKKMAQFNITWLEEPVINEDLISVKTESPIPIAAGENMFTVAEFEDACKHKIMDIAQPDIIRCGGITGFVEIAKQIQSHKIPLCNHLLPELSLSVLTAFSDCYFLEYDDLLPSDIFTENFTLRNGCMQVPQVSGSGVTLTDEAIKLFEVK